MVYVFLCSPTNSTMFTNCCRTAINDDQVHCPVCKSEVYPGADATNHQRHMSRWNWAFGAQKRAASKEKQP